MIFNEFRLDYNRKNNFLKAEIIGVFSKPEFIELADNPIKLFFLFLNLYGKEIEFNGKKGKYFFSDVIPNVPNQLSDFLSFNHKDGLFLSLDIMFAPQDLAAKAGNIFMVDLGTHLEDSLAGKI